MDITSEFLPYVALAVILFAIRETKTINNKWLPIIGVTLGILYAFWEVGGLTSKAFLNGCQYGLLGIGSVATIKYFLETHKPFK